MSGTVVFEDAKLQAVELIAETVTLNNFSVSTATTFQQTTNASNVTTNTVRFTNPTTAFVTTGNVEVGGELTVGSNVEIGTANLFVDTTTGRVGVRTESPEATFNVLGNNAISGSPANAIASFRAASSAGVNDAGVIIGSVNGNSPYISDSSSASLGLSFYTQNVNRLQIDSSGRVGIGTVSPLQTLNVKGNGQNPVIYMTDGTNNRYASGMGTHNVTNVGQRLDFYNGDSGANGTSLSSSHIRMSINASGDVGIGKTDPSAALDVNGVISASGSTSGSAHSSSCILYLLDTPQINEWSWTGATNNTLRITYSNLPDGCKAVLADVFMPQASNNDHVGHFLGQNVTQRTTWTSGRNVRPSTAFGNLAHKVIYLNFPGQSDGFEYYFGNWWPSQIIPLDSDNKMYHTVSGESTGTSSWMYIVTKGYYL